MTSIQPSQTASSDVSTLGTKREQTLERMKHVYLNAVGWHAYSNPDQGELDEIDEMRAAEEDEEHKAAPSHEGITLERLTDVSSQVDEQLFLFRRQMKWLIYYSSQADPSFDTDNIDFGSLANSMTGTDRYAYAKKGLLHFDEVVKLFKDDEQEGYSASEILGMRQTDTKWSQVLDRCHRVMNDPTDAENPATRDPTPSPTSRMSSINSWIKDQ